MKLLLKIYLENINNYDILQIADAINKNFSDDSTKIHLMTNDNNFKSDDYNFTYLDTNNVPEMINYKLNELEWDIVLPIFRPCIINHNFDYFIKKKYEEFFTNLDGVLYLNDFNQEKIKYFIIGRNYYNNFGYLFNTIYNKKNYEEEFLDISKLNNKSIFIDRKFIKTLELKSDDDYIYEMRKKLNFNIY